MFEGSLQHASDFFSDSFDTIKFKVHSSLTQFLKFCKAFAIFLYHSRIEVHGTDFLVTAIHEPRRERRFFSEDESRFHEEMLFEVEFFCRDTKRTFKFHFSCDAGYSFPEQNFGVNCLTFSERYGFCVKSPAESCSVLDILRCIINRKADWQEHTTPHVSSLVKILQLRNTRKYRLFGTPYFEKAECPISFERETCMRYSGCNCSVSRQISLSSVRGMYVASRLNESGLRCPFCRQQLIHCIHDIGLGDNSIDVSCIDNVPLPEDIRFHQDDAIGIPGIYGCAESCLSADKQELLDGFAKLAEVEGQGLSYPIFRNLGRIPEQDRALFFPEQPISNIDADADDDADDDADADAYVDADSDSDANAD
jgi:hypothetical protein